MKVQYLDAKNVGRMLKKLLRAYDDIFWSVAWMTKTPLLDELVENKKKIRKFIVGIDFAHTCPVALAKLANIPGVKVSTGHLGVTFHPKIYLFKNGDNFAAIVGSSNFTLGGIKSNDEASLLVEGTSQDIFFTDIQSAIDAWWESGSIIDKNLLDSYALHWNACKKSREYLSQDFKIYKPTSTAPHPNLLGQTWLEYLATLTNAVTPNIDGRLAVLRRSRELFNAAESFSDIDALGRKALSGYIGKREIIGTGLEEYDWGWFGSMKGAGVFKNRVNDNDVNLSLALEQIPLWGTVSKEDYVSFASYYSLAFINSEREGRIPTASRLLAMKRPDYFICVDGRNIGGLANDLGFKRNKLNIDTYWDFVVQPIIQSSWWNARRPIGHNGKIWDARVAMLDVAYYEWE